MAKKTVTEARLSLNKSYLSGESSATLNLGFTSDVVGLEGGREYVSVELSDEMAALLDSEIEKAESALEADGVFSVDYAEKEERI